MKTLKVLIMLMPVVIFANPLMTGVINEFETDTVLGQKFELHALGAGGDIGLYGTYVFSQAGTACIDTFVTLPNQGYATIDESFLSGPFFLSLSAGSLGVYLPYCFSDMIKYPAPLIPAPPAGASAARYIFGRPNYLPNYDWYLDSTPSFGSANDDYPGCKVSGHVYLGNDPARNAEVVADCYDSIIDPEPFLKIDTIFTGPDGSFSFDSLISARYWISARIAGFAPMGELTPILHALYPLTDFDFTFNWIEDFEKHGNGDLLVNPNPFRTTTTFSIGHRAESKELKIYDIRGRLVKTLPFALGSMPFAFVWPGDDDQGNPLPAGVYVCRCSDGTRVMTRKIIKL